MNNHIIQSRHKFQKLVIITHSVFGGNYGGVLQAYALQTVLTEMGHKVVTDAPIKDRTNMRERIIPVIKYFLKYTVKPKLVLSTPPSVKKVIASEVSNFAKDNINLIDILDGKKRPLNDSLIGIDGFVVGSDQVWRSRYCDVPYNLLDFTASMKNIVRISYAASFGKDDLSEYSSKLIIKTAELAKKFNAISVRESSGVNLCKNKWGVDADCLVDPTLLLSKKSYLDITKRYEEILKPSVGNLFVYVLDRDAVKQQIIEKVAKERELVPFEIMPEPYSTKKKFHQNTSRHILPSVPQWLRSFEDADYVVTDSFHGCVFSIIFNKPFIVIGNNFRGLARFTSLLKLFELEDRLVSSVEELSSELLAYKVDWDRVNSIRSSEKKRSYEFLYKNLKVKVNS